MNDNMITSKTKPSPEIEQMKREISQMKREIATLHKRLAYRTKKETANPQSLYETAPLSGHLGGTVGFYGTVGLPVGILSGVKGSSPALASLITYLAARGLFTDSTT